MSQQKQLAKPLKGKKLKQIKKEQIKKVIPIITQGHISGKKSQKSSEVGSKKTKSKSNLLGIPKVKIGKKGSNMSFGVTETSNEEGSPKKTVRKTQKQETSPKIKKEQVKDPKKLDSPVKLGNE